MNITCCKIRVVMYLLAFGMLICRNVIQEVVFEDIGLYTSSKILELQTYNNGLLVKLSIIVSKVIAINIQY